MTTGFMDARAMDETEIRRAARDIIKTITGLKPGDKLKVFFPVVLRSDNCDGERMWVVVTDVDATDGMISGTLRNAPVLRTDLAFGQTVRFSADRILTQIIE